MSRIPLPAVLFFVGTSFFDDASAPGSPSPLTAATPSSPATSLWTAGTQSGIGPAQITEVAQAIEEVIKQDLAGTLHENKTIGINADASVTPTRPAFDVVMVVSGDTEVTITVGSQAPFSINKAASLAALIRSIPGHGSTFIPA